MVKKFLALVLILSLFLIAYGYWQATEPKTSSGGESPRIEVRPKSFNFGTVDYGQRLEKEFLLSNQGKEELIIKRVATSCGCTQAQVGKKILAPGEETVLRVVYDTKAMTGPKARGRQERIIYLKSNDPVQPQLEVKIYANVN